MRNDRQIFEEKERQPEEPQEQLEQTPCIMGTRKTLDPDGKATMSLYPPFDCKISAIRLHFDKRTTEKELETLLNGRIQMTAPNKTINLPTGCIFNGEHLFPLMQEWMVKKSDRPTLTITGPPGVTAGLYFYGERV